MRSPQPLAVVALSRKFNLHPAAAGVLVALYRSRHHRSLARLACTAGTTANSVRVYVSEIRGIMGTHAITCDYASGYLLGDGARQEIRKALEAMYSEVASFIQPLLAA